MHVLLYNYNTKCQPHQTVLLSHQDRNLYSKEVKQLCRVLILLSRISDMISGMTKTFSCVIKELLSIDGDSTFRRVCFDLLRALLSVRKR